MKHRAEERVPSNLRGDPAYPRWWNYDGDFITLEEGDDVVRAGNSSDTIATGAGGRDIVHAGGGHDLVLSRDRVGDVINCGRGYDIAWVGRGDRTRNCEYVYSGWVNPCLTGAKCRNGAQMRMMLQDQYGKIWNGIAVGGGRARGVPWGEY
jgi:hypothetical protein